MSKGLLYALTHLCLRSPAMPRLILCLLLLIFVASAPTAAHAIEDTGKAVIAFSKALLEFDEKDYSSAEQGFADALQNNPNHFLAAFFLGLSRFHQENYQGAVDALDKAIALRKDEPEAFFYRGVSLYRLGLRETALDDFLKASQLTPEGELKREANVYILNIESRDAFLVSAVREKPWFAYVNASFNFDSNVTLDPEDITLITLPADQDDVQFFLVGGGGYHIVQKKNYRLTGEAYYSQTLYPDLNNFNFGVAHAELSNQIRFNQKNFMTIRAINEFSLLGTSKFLESIQFHIGSSHYWSKRFLTRTSGLIHRDYYFQNIINPAQNRDAWNFRPGLIQYFFFRGGKTFVNVGYHFERNSATGSDWDFTAHHVGAAFFTPIAWKVTTFVFADFIFDKDFDNVDSVLGIRRDDWSQNYGIQFSRPVQEYVTIRIHYSFLRNASNISVFEYNKHVVGTTVSFRI